MPGLGFTLSIWSLYNRVYNSRASDKVSLGNILAFLQFGKTISYSLALMDLGLVIVAFFSVNYLKRGALELLPAYPRLFLIFLGLWFVTSAITGKFAVARFKSVYFLSWQWIKAGGLMLVNSAAHLADLAGQGALPDQMMITVHPQRWHDRPLPWVKELVWQNVKNGVKRAGGRPALLSLLG